MKKKTILLIAAVILIAALLLGGLPLYSHLVYHRSLAATTLVWQFRKNAFTTEEEFTEYLGSKRVLNLQAYTIPEEAELTVPFVHTRYGGIPFYVLNGAADPEAPVIFYFPGGSYIDQPTASHWTFLDTLAADTGAAVYVPIYPKLPDHTAQDSLTALQSAYNGIMGGMVHGDVIFMGDSAGGGLALSLAMRLRDRGEPGPDKLILICPWVDVTMENPDIASYEAKDKLLDRTMLHRLGALWAGDLPADDPAVSPLYGDLSGLGDVTLFTTTGEILYPDLMLLYEKLVDSGNDCALITPEGTLFHTWPLYASLGVPESETACEEILTAVSR